MPNLEYCFIFLAKVIQAHVKKVKHRAAIIVIKQKQGQEEAPSQLWPQESLSCPRELAGHCTSPTGNSCHPRGRRGEFPSLTSVQLCHVSRRSETLRGHSLPQRGSGGQSATGQVATPCHGVRIAYQRGGRSCVGGRLGLPIQLPHDMSGILARAVPQIHTASSHPVGSSPGWGQEPR